MRIRYGFRGELLPSGLRASDHGARGFDVSSAAAVPPARSPWRRLVGAAGDRAPGARRPVASRARPHPMEARHARRQDPDAGRRHPAGAWPLASTARGKRVGHLVLDRRDRLQIGVDRLQILVGLLPVGQPGHRRQDRPPLAEVPAGAQRLDELLLAHLAPDAGLRVGRQVGGEAHAPGAGPGGVGAGHAADPGLGKRPRGLDHEVRRVAGERPASCPAPGRSRPMIHGVWQSWHPEVSTRYLPTATVVLRQRSAGQKQQHRRPERAAPSCLQRHCPRPSPLVLSAEPHPCPAIHWRTRSSASLVHELGPERRHLQRRPARAHPLHEAAPLRVARVDPQHRVGRLARRRLHDLPPDRRSPPPARPPPPTRGADRARASAAGPRRCGSDRSSRAGSRSRPARPGSARRSAAVPRAGRPAFRPADRLPPAWRGRSVGSPRRGARRNRDRETAAAALKPSTGVRPDSWHTRQSVHTGDGVRAAAREREGAAAPACRSEDGVAAVGAPCVGGIAPGSVGQPLDVAGLHAPALEGELLPEPAADRKHPGIGIGGVDRGAGRQGNPASLAAPSVQSAYCGAKARMGRIDLQPLEIDVESGVGSVAGGSEILFAGCAASLAESVKTSARTIIAPTNDPPLNASAFATDRSDVAPRCIRLS